MNEYKIISLTYKILNTTMSPYLYDLISIQPPHGHNTRSSPYDTDQTIIITQSHSSIASSDMLCVIFGTSFLHYPEFPIQVIHCHTPHTLSDFHLCMPVLSSCYTLRSPSIGALAVTLQPCYCAL